MPATDNLLRQRIHLPGHFSEAVQREAAPTGESCTETPPPLTSGVPLIGGSTGQPWDGPDQPYTTNTPTPVDGSPQTTVRFSIQMTRQQLYGSWRAIANLAERASVVEMRIEEQRPEGFDPNWLRNAVYEPLEEAGVELEDETDG